MIPDRWIGYFNQELGSGLLVTLEILVIAMFTTAIWAMMIAAMRASRFAPLRWLAISYVEIFRGTPLIVQLLLAFAVLPTIGIRLTPYQTAIIVLTLNAGTDMAELYRAGLQAVPRGQIEAAIALSMGRLTILRRVIIPLALRVILPAIGTMAVTMLLSTSFVFLLGLQDLMARGGLIYGRTSDFSVYLEIMVLYIVVGGVLTLLNHWLERRMLLP